MSIIGKTGRRSAKIMLLLSMIYMLLTLGAVTMVYPFLIMLSGSVKSSVDSREYDLYPRYLHDDASLYRKHMEGFFNESVVTMREVYGVDNLTFKDVKRPSVCSNPALLAEWNEFLAKEKLPAYMFSCGYIDARESKVVPAGQRRFRDYVSKKYSGDIGSVNSALDTHFSGWNWYFESTAGDRSLILGQECLPRYVRQASGKFAAEFDLFKLSQPLESRYYLSVEGFYRERYIKARYSNDIGRYNKAHKTAYKSYSEVRLADFAPKGAGLSDWEDFVRNTLNPLWVRVSDVARSDYAEYVICKYGGLAQAGRAHGRNYSGPVEVRIPDPASASSSELSDFELYLSGWTDKASGRVFVAPLQAINIESPESRFRRFLTNKYTINDDVPIFTLAGYQNADGIYPPQRDMHYAAFLKNKSEIRREFLSRNYRTVLDYMVFHGRGVWNTVWYCFLAVVLALIVNPMAAYALSRYKLPTSYKILLFLMLTMAFPPMVTQIPVFLMLREFGLLNTFAALLLPGLASGYSIFLLKGFFDSLPRELYESAQIDGAGEWTMFWHITMSLSKPILSVIALHAFTLAYGNFMFALLICQDERMWTLMVWLYQLQQRCSQPVVYASLIIAAIPTFVIFVFCQKIIMRGIVIPSEK